MTPASAILTALGLYLAVGFAVGVAFALAGAGRIDPAANVRGRAWRRFRLLLIPGAAALWPLLLGRWIRAVRSSQESVLPAPSRSMRTERRIHLAAWLVLTPLLLAAVAWAWLARDAAAITPPPNRPTAAPAGDTP